MSDYVIRPAAAEDAAAIDRLFVEMLQTIYERTETPAETVGYMELKEELEGSRIYVAEAGGEVVAFASVEEHRDAAEPFLYLDDFSVTKRYRGRGIGRVLLQTVEQDAAEHGLGCVGLHVEAQNAGARRLYQNCGYEVISERDGSDPDDSRLCLRKRLPAAENARRRPDRQRA